MLKLILGYLSSKTRGLQRIFYYFSALLNKESTLYSLISIGRKVIEKLVWRLFNVNTTKKQQKITNLATRKK